MADGGRARGPWSATARAWARCDHRRRRAVVAQRRSSAAIQASPGAPGSRVSSGSPPATGAAVTVGTPAKAASSTAGGQVGGPDGGDHSCTVHAASSPGSGGARRIVKRSAPGGRRSRPARGHCVAGAHHLDPGLGLGPADQAIRASRTCAASAAVLGRPVVAVEVPPHQRSRRGGSAGRGRGQLVDAGPGQQGSRHLDPDAPGPARPRRLFRLADQHAAAPGPARSATSAGRDRDRSSMGRRRSGRAPPPPPVRPAAAARRPRPRPGRTDRPPGRRRPRGRTPPGRSRRGGRDGRRRPAGRASAARRRRVVGRGPGQRHRADRLGRGRPRPPRTLLATGADVATDRSAPPARATPSRAGESLGRLGLGAGAQAVDQRGQLAADRPRGRCGPAADPGPARWSSSPARRPRPGPRPARRRRCRADRTTTRPGRRPRWRRAPRPRRAPALPGRIRWGAAPGCGGGLRPGGRAGQAGLDLVVDQAVDQVAAAASGAVRVFAAGQEQHHGAPAERGAGVGSGGLGGIGPAGLVWSGS